MSFGKYFFIYILGFYCFIVNRAILADTDKRKKANKKELLNFFAGGIAGTISSSLTAPLEVLIYFIYLLYEFF